MVNSNKLTVSKLSEMQRLILQTLQEDDDTILASLAHAVAWDYQGSYAQRGEREDAYRLCGMKDEMVLSDRFKASFYRSVKRLKRRNLIKVYEGSIDDEITNRRVHFKAVKLTDEGWTAVKFLGEKAEG